VTVRERDETPIAAAVIPVEASGWATRFTGGTGAGRRVFDEPLTEPATVRSVLRGLSDRFPDLAAALWHGDQLGEHIEVIVNDAVLGIDHTLDSRLRPGDRITLVGQYLGG
jgi:hypothetical protein